MFAILHENVKFERTVCAVLHFRSFSASRIALQLHRLWTSGSDVSWPASFSKVNTISVMRVMRLLVTVLFYWIDFSKFNNWIGRGAYHSCSSVRSLAVPLVSRMFSWLARSTISFRFFADTAWPISPQKRLFCISNMSRSCNVQHSSRTEILLHCFAQVMQLTHSSRISVSVCPYLDIADETLFEAIPQHEARLFAVSVADVRHSALSFELATHSIVNPFRFSPVRLNTRMPFVVLNLLHLVKRGLLSLLLPTIQFHGLEFLELRPPPSCDFGEEVIPSQIVPEKSPHPQKITHWQTLFLTFVV